MLWDNSCYECKRGFDHPNNMKSHLTARRHHRGYYCHKCERMFITERGLTQHQQTLHYHACQTCKLEFDTEDSLNEHENQFHSLMCAHCERIFRTDEGREQHRKIVHKIVCRECKISFDDDEAFTSHNSDFHTFKCPECPPRVFRTNGALEAHLRSSLHYLQCVRCKQRFKNERAWLQHRDAAHPFECQKCPSVFGSQINLKNHLLSHHHFPCQWCTQEFDSSQDRQLHLNSAHISERLKCQKKLKKPEEQQEHLKSCGGHSNKTTHNSPIVSPLLQDSSSRKNNEFACPLCEQFSENSAAVFEHILTKHMYRCHDCTAHFEQELDLLAHICHAHSQEALHQDTNSHLMCLKCGTSFVDADGLSRHIIDSHLLKCAKCPGCLFLSMGSLAEHAKIAHSENVVKIPASTIGSERESRINGAQNGSFSKEPSLCSEGETLVQSVKSSLEKIYPPSLEVAQADKLPVYHFGKGDIPSSPFRCDECNGVFETASELEIHFLHSPFHGVNELKCHECDTTFSSQIQLLRHINSMPHQSKWVLSLI